MRSIPCQLPGQPGAAGGSDIVTVMLSGSVAVSGNSPSPKGLCGHWQMCPLCDNFLNNNNSDVLRTVMRPAQVRDWYVESFNELRSFPRIQVQHSMAQLGHWVAQHGQSITSRKAAVS
jgi:hypothetical protein